MATNWCCDLTLPSRVYYANDDCQCEKCIPERYCQCSQCIYERAAATPSTSTRDDRSHLIALSPEDYMKFCCCEQRQEVRSADYRGGGHTEQLLRSRAQLERLLDDLEPSLANRGAAAAVNCVKCVTTTTYHGQLMSYDAYPYYRYEQYRHKELLPINQSAKTKRFQCIYCDKSFGKSSHLRDHVRTHTGERPFRCSFCGKAFTQYSNLRTHVRIHTGEKPFKCKYCEKSFTQAVTLRSHLRTHTNEAVANTDRNIKSH